MSYCLASLNISCITGTHLPCLPLLFAFLLPERKNCNLPGVKVDIPVLTEKDIDDLQNFCCKHRMDYVAASFVQSAEDVRFIRRVLNEAGGQRVKIISKVRAQSLFGHCTWDRGAGCAANSWLSQVGYNAGCGA